MHRIRIFARHWRPLVGAAGLQLAVAIGLRLVPLPALRKAGRRMRPLVIALLPGAEHQVIWAIEAAGRRLMVSTCLVRALVAEMRLASSERPLSLAIGVKCTPSSGLQSHAWLTDGRHVLVGGPVDDDFVRFATWESAV